MPDYLNASSISKGAKIGGWVMSILPCLLLLMSASMKFVQPAGFDEGLQHMGWSVDKMKALGIVELSCTLIYLFPKTAVLGAILLTAYMGGAIATHVRVGDPFWTQILVGVFIWGGLYLRDMRIRALIPLRSN